ncbi:MAG: peptidoglycan DD-metalloendopeptidase family protein [Paraprevotella sp.]|nr:peptidoglycan DD-metalloendopeptidase family protein [Paraprevotella sp.]
MFFNFKRLKTTGTIVVMAMLSLPVAGQDLLARQAPIDTKMRAVDSVALQRLIGDEQLENPAFGLYPDWNNQYAHHYDVELPEEYKIDLRHFCMPTPSRRITSNYGYRASFRRQHKGLDIKVYIGDTIRAAFSGKVRIVDYEGKGYGNYVVIRHPNGLETIYGHLSKHLVRENQVVKAGGPIGLGGNTGRSTGSHLHFETRFLGQAIDPSEMFDFAAQDVTGDYYVFRSGQKGHVISSSSSSVVAQKENAPDPRSESKPRSKTYRVRAGENLSVIASKFGTTIETLCKLNGLSRKTVLRPGQIIKYS